MARIIKALGSVLVASDRRADHPHCVARLAHRCQRRPPGGPNDSPAHFGAKKTGERSESRIHAFSVGLLAQSSDFIAEQQLHRWSGCIQDQP